MSKLIIAPLSTPQTMTRAAWQAIQGADRLFLQTTRHPSAAPVLEAGLTFISMDDLYEQAEDFDVLNLSIAQRLTEGAGGVYAVMGGGCGAQLPAIEKVLYLFILFELFVTSLKAELFKPFKPLQRNNLISPYIIRSFRFIHVL